eukprot:15453938-Alexandrium_andersonii.AAC.1
MAMCRARLGPRWQHFCLRFKRAAASMSCRTQWPWPGGSGSCTGFGSRARSTCFRTRICGRSAPRLCGAGAGSRSLPPGS